MRVLIFIMLAFTSLSVPADALLESDDSAAK